jgi:hypothetical protein
MILIFSDTDNAHTTEYHISLTSYTRQTRVLQ